MSYQRLITENHPGLIVLMIDQSYSMTQPFDDSTKAKSAATAVNRVLYEIIEAGKRGATIKDKCLVVVVGYGAEIEPVMSATGKPSKLHANPLRIVKTTRRLSSEGGESEPEWEQPIWVEPRGAGGTPMAEAFARVYQLVQEWISAHPDHFPPVVINITDGEPNNEKQARDEAQALLKLATTDGTLLLFNVHISNRRQGEIILPTTPRAMDSYGRFLFDISSVLPPSLLREAEAVGLDPEPSARGCVFNGSPETLVKVLTFGSSMMRDQRRLYAD